MIDWTSIEKGEPEPEQLESPFPLLPIKHAVLLPGVILPITITRKRSMQLIEKAHKEKSLLVIITQKNNISKEPQAEDLYKVGTLAKVIRLAKLPEEHTHMIVYGSARCAIGNILRHKNYLQATVNLLPDTALAKKTSHALSRELKSTFTKMLTLTSDTPKDLKKTLERISDFSLQVHFIALHTNLKVEEKQRILEIRSAVRRAKRLLKYMQREIQLLEIRNEIQDKTYSDIDQQQRDYFLRQQIKVLQNELGGEGSENEIIQLQARAKKKKWSEESAEHFDKEIERLRRAVPTTPEYSLSLNYLEFMLNLPWNEYTQDRLDIKQAARILDRNHYGIQKVKNRIIEHLAVLQLTQALRGPILCLCGPPGVGKTSLGKSIAEALSRKCARISLGGMHDEAEIRGHRRTYIGAMPGRILQQISKLRTSNPVIILDEVDKMQRDFRGDPSSALLEVLDPSQNNTFTDNYLEVSYDLSKVLFITTANTTQSIQSPLLDRMEVIEMSGYTVAEKLQIAKRHLVPVAYKAHGLQPSQLRFTQSVLQRITMNYTRESGVRELDRNISAIMRRVARFVAAHELYDPKINSTELRHALGAPRYLHETYADAKLPGVCTGLAWTEAGGELLQVEATLYAGKGKVTLSGQLGEVMRESAMTSFSYLRAHSVEMQLPDELFSQYDLHVHVPSGAVPKDGPSAGITMLTAVASLYTRRRVHPQLAMSGELTLSGRVLPVGGIKEKILAARIGGIRKLLLSEENRKDVEELSSEYTEGVQIEYVKQASEVLSATLLPKQDGHVSLRYTPTSATKPLHAD